MEHSLHCTISIELTREGSSKQIVSHVRVRESEEIHSCTLFVFFEFDKTVPRSRMREGKSLRNLTQDSLMKRILVIGSGGAGKSTFAKRLGEIPRTEGDSPGLALLECGMGGDAQRPVASNG